MLLLLALTNPELGSSITALVAIILAEMVRELRSWQRGRRLEELERLLMEDGLKKPRRPLRHPTTGKKKP